MLKPRALTQVLAQANSDNVLSTLYVGLVVLFRSSTLLFSVFDVLQEFQ